jgi:hypothetical protein
MVRVLRKCSRLMTASLFSLVNTLSSPEQISCCRQINMRLGAILAENEILEVGFFAGCKQQAEEEPF